jgi:hypothetical protein
MFLKVTEVSDLMACSLSCRSLAIFNTEDRSSRYRRNLVTFYQITRCHIPGDSNLHTQSRENPSLMNLVLFLICWVVSTGLAYVKTHDSWRFERNYDSTSALRGTGFELMTFLIRVKCYNKNFSITAQPMQSVTGSKKLKIKVKEISISVP